VMIPAIARLPPRLRSRAAAWPKARDRDLD
jgi:hypothetical protein